MNRQRGRHSPSRREARRTHRLRSIVVNARHVWQCKYCGREWNPDADVQAIEARRCDEGER